jgi:hypothetical protein
MTNTTHGKRLLKQPMRLNAYANKYANLKQSVTSGRQWRYAMGDFLVQMIYIFAIFTCGALMGEKYGANRRNSR